LDIYSGGDAPGYDGSGRWPECAKVDLNRYNNPGRARHSVRAAKTRCCSVEIISLTPRFNAVNHERAQEKTV